MGRGANFSKLYTRSAGQIINAANDDAEWQNILNNFDPSGIGSYFNNSTEMQATSNPAPGGTPSVPTSLLTWMQQIQYQIANLTGTSYWYQNPNVAKIEMYGGSSAPTGWLLCDGSAISRTTYAVLFAVISTSYGAGDGSTTFNVPDLRGRIPVGAGTGTWVKTFTASNSSGSLLLTVPSNQVFYTGTPFVPSTTGTLPTGLSPSTTYYAIYESATTIKVATSLANAETGTAIAWTDAGTGTHTATVTLSARALGDIGGEESHAELSTEVALHGHTVNDPTHYHGIPNSTVSGAAAYWYPPVGPNNGAGAYITNPASTGITVNNSTGGLAHNNMQPFGVVNYIIKT